MLTLSNRSGRMLVFVLDHDSFCSATGRCECRVERLGRRRLRVARSLTVPAGAAIADLPEAVLSVPPVARALASGELTARRAAPAPLAVAESAPATEPQTTARKKRGRG